MRRSSCKTAVHALLAAFVCVALGGCSFLADEFGWLDRRAPAVDDSPLTERP